jgi:hypothetical protein
VAESTPPLPSVPKFESGQLLSTCDGLAPKDMFDGEGEKANWRRPKMEHATAGCMSTHMVPSSLTKKLTSRITAEAIYGENNWKKIMYKHLLGDKNY